MYFLMERIFSKSNFRESPSRWHRIFYYPKPNTLPSVLLSSRGRQKDSAGTNIPALFFFTVKFPVTRMILVLPTNLMDIVVHDQFSCVICGCPPTRTCPPRETTLQAMISTCQRRGGGSNNPARLKLAPSAHWTVEYFEGWSNNKQERPV